MFEAIKLKGYFDRETLRRDLWWHLTRDNFGSIIKFDLK